MPPTQKAKRHVRRKKRRTQVEVRQMALEDLSKVWHIGEKTFTPSSLQFAYRTWNTDELLSLFNSDPELCLVAEDAKSTKIVGFALGTILKRPFSPWTYGYSYGQAYKKGFRKGVSGDGCTESWRSDLRIKVHASLWWMWKATTPPESVSSKS